MRPCQVCRPLVDAFTDPKFQYKLYTDGSGFTDHIGGFASILVSSNGTPCTVSCGCSMHMETGRAEFMAILQGLRTIFETNNYDTRGEDLSFLERVRPGVLIISDREDLVGSINRIYERKRNGDLWASFEWYEKYLTIEAVHVKRETAEIHKNVDRIASGMRMVLIDYLNTNKETDYFN